jgi:wyosine [tRNA(Phe)-imidazoG37] synthetase (radical SAM superfamily)
MSIIFGPINSRRFGKSLGIDLSPTKKQCNFDCLYCELEPAKTLKEYEDIISIGDIIDSVKESLEVHSDISVLTITANGEPTLYPYLKELMVEINRIKGDINTLILSNGSTIGDKRVQEALMLFDTVKLSLDCATSKCLKRLDRAYSDITIDSIKEGMVEFRREFKGSFIIEILVVKGINDKLSEIEELNSFLLKLNPTRIDLGTVDRPPAYRVEALSYEELRDISLEFSSSLPIYITSRKKTTSKPSLYTRDMIIDTVKKRPLTKDDIDMLFDEKSKILFKEMLNMGDLKLVDSGGYSFFVLN